MKGMLRISFLLLVLMLTAGSGMQLLNDTDTLKIATSGINNRMNIDTLCNDKNDTLPHGMDGEIIQSGENNRVEISRTSGANDLNKLKVNRNKNKPDQVSVGRNQITIKQTGKNNSAIINTP